MNFRIGLSERVRAAAGLPAYIRRRRRIEDLEEALIGQLNELWEDAEARFGAGTEEAHKAFLEEAMQIDLSRLNDLIDRHNRFFPIEANLRTEVSSGKLMWGDQAWEPLAPVTHHDLIKRMRQSQQGSA